MAVKKKTIKDLNEIVESLEEKIKHLEEKVKKAEKLEERIKHLEDNLHKFRSNPDKEIEIHKRERKQEKRKCRNIKCNTCGKAFDEQWMLEKHLGEEHGKEKTFDCDFCDGSFYTKWRLEKHVKTHDEPNVKFCHYFNNFKKCPFKELGCKFRHAESQQCKFQTNCTNRLCQYRHQTDHSICKELNWQGKSCEFKTKFDVRMKNHMLGDHGIGDNFKCDYCEFEVGDKGLLKNHIEKDHQEKYETCGGNCSDRMYDENTFECVNCETRLCIICSQSDNRELCWGCENLLRD